MKKLSIHHVRNAFAILVVGLLLAGTYFAGSNVLKVQNAQAISTANLSGWTWSENIGWLSLNSINCDQDKNGFVDTFCGGNNTSTPVYDYGVSIGTANRTGGGVDYFSGQAWSDNIGWVSFNSGDTVACGATLPQVNWTTGKASGWIKALAASGSWDGCINLSGTATDGGTYGVTISGNDFSGYAWGSDVIGWMHFSPTVNGISFGMQLAAPPCAAVDVPAGSWGDCIAISQCTAPPATKSNVDGAQVGVCSNGGTTVRSCVVPTQTCVVGSTSTSTKPRYWQF